MRSLVLVALALSPLVSACDKGDAKSSAIARSEGVLAQADAAPASKSQDPASAHAAATPGAPRRLCDADLAKPGRPLPKGLFSHVEAKGEAPLADTPPFGGGRWTWLNLFAGWCGPCKEEMPRLVSFGARLSQAGSPINLVFVSVDDDARELTNFLGAQPAGGVRTAYWLKEGAPRDGFLGPLKLKDQGSLPKQILVDPDGAARCVIEGAIEESDYDQLRSIFTKR